MHTLIAIGTIVLLHLLAVVSPGPDFVMAVRNSLTYSRRTGIYTAIGLGLGIAMHITYCIAGLALIISRSILVFNFFKYLGAGYLIYIGIKSLITKSGLVKVVEQEKKADISPLKAIRIGFLTNVLNPKATLFFLSLFTLVISPDLPAYVLAIVSLIMVVDTMLWFSLVSIFFTHSRIQKTFNRFQGIFNKTFGGLLVALGIKVALAGRE